MDLPFAAAAARWTTYAIVGVIQNAVRPDNGISPGGTLPARGAAAQNFVPKAPRYLKPKRISKVVPTLDTLSLKLFRVRVAVASKHSSE
jgi:hypothetical protein